MEGIASVWSYQESINELKNKLIFTMYELESTRIDVKEEMRKYEEYTKQLLQLLNAAYRERDEARDQLQRLLSKIMPNSTTEICSVFTNLQSENPSLKTKGTNSSFTESDSLSEAYNHHSNGSTPVDSFIDQVSSPEMSNMNISESSNPRKAQQQIIQESNLPKSISIFSSGNVSASISTMSSGEHNVDHSSSVIDKLIKGKPLPQKGRFLQAVMEAGPLLQTLLVAGPLPRWQNPPPLQPFQIPAVSIKGSDPENVDQKPITNSNYVAQGLLTSSYPEMPSQICSTPVLNFSCSPRSCLDNGVLSSTAMNRDFPHRGIRTGKRQGLQ
ncbi:uncharacterized protein LOC122057534 [Macadamia integrifolia]|uniref:uncharacterized protein LOC122057534 n=1 Tax=Macadamia integrifolia TaxID=60698 RepID=UPI001C52ABD1|nr:uncharacterized protein LOC122057534 [Macadamia integrifolia]